MNHCFAAPAAAAIAGLSLFVSSCALHRESAALPPETRVVDMRLLKASAGTDVLFKHTVELQIVEIRRPRGIGQAEFTLPAGIRPDKTVFRLHLRGLEGLSVAHGGSSVQVSVSSHGDLAIREWREDELPLAEKDRIPVSPVSASGDAPCIPLDGWFDIGLPASCTGDCVVSLSWVDFYR